ncbi:MAG: hypothetical protein PGN20_12165 [Agrobacterium cavarae]
MHLLLLSSSCCRQAWRAWAITQLSSLNAAVTDIVQGPAANLRNSSDLSDAILNAIANEKSAALNEDAARISTYVDAARTDRAKIGQIIATLEKETIQQFMRR